MRVKRELDTLEAVSPLDGRYRHLIDDAARLFSEESLMKHRCKVEIEYLIAVLERALPERTRDIRPDWREQLRSIYNEFEIEDAKAVKKLEEETRHDVKALEMYLGGILRERGLGGLSSLIHLCLTSEDVNNLAQSLMISEFMKSFYIPSISDLLVRMAKLAVENEGTVMLARTHGQPATPTTLGRELAVYCYRIAKITEKAAKLRLHGKVGGAVGNLAAHRQALPKVDWLEFVRSFVEGLGLEAWPANTQVIAHEYTSELLSLLSLTCSLLSNLCRDLWLLSTLGYLYVLPRGVGSSTMPHKSNPVELELAEGNFDFAANILNSMANRLLSSRLQRDLSDSTIKRNYGVALCHLLLGVRSLSNALDRISVDASRMEFELNSHAEVISEAYQVVLRIRGVEEAFEQMLEAVRGRKVDLEEMTKLAERLAPDEETLKKLMSIKPSEFIGYSKEQTEYLVRSCLEIIKGFNPNLTSPS
ncbi:MAG: adenylosuccinate lyase [Candidatus Bathyarchaeia archaeon]